MIRDIFIKLIAMMLPRQWILLFIYNYIQKSYSTTLSIYTIVTKFEFKYGFEFDSYRKNLIM